MDTFNGLPTNVNQYGMSGIRILKRKALVMARVKNYEIFKGEELKIADLIQRRRLQMLIHSCIYYELDRNIISDKQWDSWAKELKKLQEENPSIAAKVCFAEDFKDWDATTGAFLPIKRPEILFKAKCILYGWGANNKPDIVIPQKTKNKPTSSSGSKRLF